MGDEYEPTRFSLEHQERGYNDYFDISTSVLRFRLMLFEEEWRYIDSIEDATERRRRESEQLTTVLGSIIVFIIIHTHENITKQQTCSVYKF